LVSEKVTVGVTPTADGDDADAHMADDAEFS
jgi:hypothetical protein